MPWTLISQGWWLRHMQVCIYCDSFLLSPAHVWFMVPHSCCSCSQTWGTIPWPGPSSQAELILITETTQNRGTEQEAGVVKFVPSLLQVPMCPSVLTSTSSQLPEPSPAPALSPAIHVALPCPTSCLTSFSALALGAWLIQLCLLWKPVLTHSPQLASNPPTNPPTLTNALVESLLSVFLPQLGFRPPWPLHKNALSSKVCQALGWGTHSRWNGPYSEPHMWLTLSSTPSG